MTSDASNNHSVAEHYAHGSLWETIENALAVSGKKLDRLQVDDLAPIDAFHIRGRKATVELAAHAGIRKEFHIVDVGCGLGGTARYLASVFACRVTGIDLTEEYIEVADRLGQMIGLDNLVSFQQGSALNMPFADGSFDIAWTEHTQMNIEDKKGFYREIARVLKPGGQLVFHDVFSGDNEAPCYPVPWAETAAISFLSTCDHLREHIRDAGFSIQYWQDKSEESLDWFQHTVAKAKSTGPAPLGTHLLMGKTAGKKLQNLIRNLSEKRIFVIQAILKKSA